MVEENTSQEFRLKNIEGTRNNFVEKIEQNKLMSKKYKEVCTIFVWFVPLYRTLSYFSFWGKRMYSNFYFCFFAWCSYRSYEFCNRIKNLY